MQEMADMELLRQYVLQNSEDAFAALVARHVNLVFSAALRKTGSTAAAEEITQAVFIILARKAGRLGAGTVLSGWLYHTARLTTASYLRTQIRRAHREQEAYMQSLTDEPVTKAWQEIEPLLEDGMGRLGEKDRNAIVLRFFDGKSFQEIGAAVGSSENAAKKRVAHALEKLRKFFTKRGVDSTAAIIAGAISANSVKAAPVGLAKTISVVAMAKGAAAGTTTFFTSVLVKTLAVCGSIMIVAVGTAIYFHEAGQSSGGKFQMSNNQSALATSNQNGTIHLQPPINSSNNSPILNENERLDAAVAHLREVLHTRPTTHELFDSEGITNAIDAFGLYRRDAFNVLLDYSYNSDTNTIHSEEYVRVGSIFGMGYVGKYLPEVPPTLWAMISSAPIIDRFYIFSALKQIGFTTDDLPALTGLLADEDSMHGLLSRNLPQAIADVLKDNPQSVASYIPPLENLLENGGSNAQFRVALALIESQGTNNPNVLPAIHALFQRPNDRHNQYYKLLAAEILGDVGQTAQPLVPDLLDFAKSASEIGVQESVYDAIAKIEPDTASQNEGVAEALKKQQDAKMWDEKWKSGKYTFDDLRVALKDPYQAYIAADQLAEMGTNAVAAVPDMIKALWGMNEALRNNILDDIHKVDPQMVVTKIYVTSFNTGNLHEFLDKQPPTQQIKLLQQDVVNFEWFSGWVLPEEFADFTNRLAQQNLDAYKDFVKYNTP
jgi:RNA polymerase sigma factor (sigma-70 family)